MHSTELSSTPSPFSTSLAAHSLVSFIQLVANLSKNDASKLVEEHLSPRILGPMSSTTSKALTNGHANDTSPRLQSFVLPYYAVILVCAYGPPLTQVRPLADFWTHELHTCSPSSLCTFSSTRLAQKT